MLVLAKIKFIIKKIIKIIANFIYILKIRFILKYKIISNHKYYNYYRIEYFNQNYKMFNYQLF